MITEIHVEDVGIMRPLNSWQINRIKRMARGPNKAIAFYAFGLGMTVKEFKSLPAEKQREARDAHLRLTAPSAMVPATQTSEPRQTAPRPWQRLSEAQMEEIGRKLLRVKQELPHGHFRAWVEEKSGITYSQAQRFMRAVKDGRR